MEGTPLWITDSDVRRRLLLPERNENEMAVIWYLVGRGIDYDIIKECIDNGLIFESEVYHNCVFLGFDENGKAAYASFRSSRDDSQFKGEAVGSDKRYSFRIEANSNTIHVFESAIDLLYMRQALINQFRKSLQHWIMRCRITLK